MKWWIADVLVAAAAALAGSGAGAQGAPFVFRGMCDASAAVGLGRHRFVVADDELDVLLIYERGTPTPVDSVDLVDFLGNRKPKGKPTEADIEGAAAIGARVYWISSHGRAGKTGEVDRHRWRLFATDIVAGARGPTVKPAGVAYTRLVDDLVADPRFGVLVDAVRRKPEDKGGFSIEGLAATASGGLLIGFRNPQPHGKALVVPLRNPASLVDKGARPEFGDPILLDLGGRGVRSMERVGQEVLISAGPFGTAASSTVRPAFALFRWNGERTSAPARVRSLDAGTFRPEAMYFDDENKALVLLSDDGDEAVDGVACSKRPQANKSFRAMTLAWTPDR